MRELKFYLKTLPYWIVTVVAATTLIDAFNLGTNASFFIGGVCALFLATVDDHVRVRARAIVKAGGK